MSDPTTRANPEQTLDQLDTTYGPLQWLQFFQSALIVTVPQPAHGRIRCIPWLKDGSLDEPTNNAQFQSIFHVSFQLKINHLVNFAVLFDVIDRPLGLIEPCRDATGVTAKGSHPGAVAYFAVLGHVVWVTWRPTVRQANLTLRLLPLSSPVPASVQAIVTWR